MTEKNRKGLLVIWKALEGVRSGAIPVCRNVWWDADRHCGCPLMEAYLTTLSAEARRRAKYHGGRLVFSSMVYEWFFGLFAVGNPTEKAIGEFVEEYDHSGCVLTAFRRMAKRLRLGY